MSWDPWGQQLLVANVGDYGAPKRPRTDGYYPADPGAGFGRVVLPPQPTPTSAGMDGSSLTASIFAALQNRRPKSSESIFAPAPVAQDPQLGSMLLDSLRSALLPSEQAAAPSLGFDALQELRRAAGFDPPAAPQASSPAIAAPAPAPVAPPPAPAREPAPPQPAQPPRPAPVVPTSAEPVFDERDRSPREDDIESDDDGVPHRLPPGFGAIPEDIVEERARAREEQRVLQLKATQPCRFGKRCKKRDCPNAHPEGRDIDTAWNPCAFGRRCKRKGCFYDHPEGRIIDDNPEKGMCKFGARCSRPDCLYDHPEGRAPLAGPDPRICYFCHDPGHIATDCPRNPESWAFARAEGQSQVVQVSSQKAITANT